MLLVMMSWICLDLYRISITKEKVRVKLSYLDTLNSEEVLGTIYEIIKDSYTKPSLRTNYNRFLSLDPNTFSIDKTIDYEEYVDDYDLLGFETETCNIPDIEDKSNEKLARIRNKMIFRTLLEYAVAKLNVGGICCFPTYRIVKDVFGFITLADSCRFISSQLSLNGTIIEDDSEYPIKLLKADKLQVKLLGVQDHRRLNGGSFRSETTINLQQFFDNSD